MASFETVTIDTTSDDGQRPALAAMTASEAYGDPDSALRALSPMQMLRDAVAHLARYAVDFACDAERR